MMHKILFNNCFSHLVFAEGIIRLGTESKKFIINVSVISKKNECTCKHFLEVLLYKK